MLWLSDGFAIADAEQRHITVIGHLVADGCTADVADTTPLIAPYINVGTNGTSRQQMLELLHMIEDEQPITDGTKLSWRSERVWVLGEFRGMVDGTLTNPIIPQTTHTGYLLQPLLLSDARLYALYMQDMIMATTAPDWPTAQRQMPAALPAAIRDHPYLHQVVRLFIPSESIAKCDYLARSQRRLAAVAIAARLYAADHNGQIPTALTDLVPSYLSTFPMDAMTGAPIKYAADPPRFYCIGNDGVDHGGTPPDPDARDSYHRKGDFVIYLLPQPRK